MTDKAVISGTLSEIKRIRSRKVAQIIIEVPEEHYQQAHNALGWDFDNTWVAIARMESEHKKADPAKAPKAPRNWGDLSLTQQAGMRCNDVAFQRFIGANDADDAAAFVRERCGVTSRKSIVPDTRAGQIWRDIDYDFRASQRGITLSQEDVA